MATPTRSQAVSTPKSHLSNTPGKHMASPRPATSSAAQKSLAYKSPAVKTPASVHGHTHNLSVSSQPSSTPLGPAAAHDGLMNLDSPAVALMNSIAPTGLTPLNSTQDGLGITTQPRGIPLRGPEPIRSPEAERLYRLQQIVDVLKTKMVGRGITREAVERIARVHRFEALWDEDNLTIAGNIVELEIMFDSLSHDNVTDLSLKLNSADGESHVQEAATSILKSQIGMSDPSASQLYPSNLEDLSTNIEYLAQMDRININPNTFEAVGGLYKTLRSIWEEEKKRVTWRDELQHLRRSAVGRPNIDRKPRLGITVDYWKTRSEEEAHESVPGFVRGHDAMQYHVFCEESGASILSSLEWLSPKVLQEKKPENVLDLEDSLEQPSWSNTKTALEHSGQVDLNAAQLSEAVDLLNATFVAEFTPRIWIPLNTALRLDSANGSIAVDQSMAITYAQALQNARNEALPQQSPELVEPRWPRRLPLEGRGIRGHSYALYPAPQIAELWVYPLSRTTFGHPRDLADILPITRQYAVLWALLRNLVIDPGPSIQPSAYTTANDKRRVVKRSNIKSKKATELIGGCVTATVGSAQMLNIDISLDVISDVDSCKLEIFAPLPNSSNLKSRSPFIHYTIVVKPNGIIEVVDVSEKLDSDVDSLKNRVCRMLRLTEDIGLVTEWLIERASKQIS